MIFTATQLKYNQLIGTLASMLEEYTRHHVSM